MSLPTNTASTSTTTGALTLVGGLGVGEKINCGGRITAPTMTCTTAPVSATDVVRLADLGGSPTMTSLNLTGTTASTSTTTGNLINAGGFGNAGALYNGGVMRVTNTTASTSYTTGALTVSGGVGVSGNLHVGSSGVLVVSNTTNSTSLSTGALICSGGAAFNGNLNVNNTLNLHDSTSSIRFNNIETSKRIVMYNHASDDTTRFIGFGIASYALRIQLIDTSTNVSFRCGTGQDTEQELMRIDGHLGGNVDIYHTTESSSTSTGALVVSGGVGVAKNLNVGGKANVATAPTASNDVVRLTDIGGAVFSNTSVSGQWGQGSSGSSATVYCQKVGHMVTVSQKSLASSYTIQTTSDYLRLWQGDLPSTYRPDNWFP